MKFKLSNADSFPDDEYAKRLKKLGFKIDNRYSKFFCATVNYTGNPEIEINTLEELMNFIKEWGRIVIDEDEIIIYDGYLE